MKIFKLASIIVGAVIVTALGIDAADTLNGNNGTMFGQLIAIENSNCPSGMLEVETGVTFSCVDQFEATLNKACDLDIVSNEIDTARALQDRSCTAHSKSGEKPWTFITRDQAMLACSKAGKRLPTAKEWYQIAQGTQDNKDQCNIGSGSVDSTGKNQACLSLLGAYDMIGNVWEWVQDDVIEGQYNGRLLPEEGYVTQIDSAGVPTVTENVPSELFSQDYFWSEKAGAYGVMRGGYFGSDSDAGVYAFHAKTAPTTAIGTIGFRCVR